MINTVFYLFWHSAVLILLKEFLGNYKIQLAVSCSCTWYIEASTLLPLSLLSLSSLR